LAYESEVENTKTQNNVFPSLQLSSFFFDFKDLLPFFFRCPSPFKSEGDKNHARETKNHPKVLYSRPANIITKASDAKNNFYHGSSDMHYLHCLNCLWIKKRGLTKALQT